jgi:formate dehydrogenase subunit delta
MDGKKLVKMANEIAAFFAVEPTRQAAVDGVAGHIKRFWEPRMRRELLAVLDRGADHGMHELVVEALTTHRSKLEPAKAG